MTKRCKCVAKSRVCDPAV